MNEEEILKIVDNFIDGFRQYDTETGKTIIPYKYGEGQKFVYKEDFEAIQGLLDLYNKEKEKNKEHKTRIRNLECKIIRQKEQISGLRSKYHVDAWLEDDYISKDKIKAKIEELKLIADNGANAVRFAMTHDDEVERIQKQKDISAMIDILQSLLDKE